MLHPDMLLREAAWNLARHRFFDYIDWEDIRARRGPGKRICPIPWR